MKTQSEVQSNSADAKASKRSISGDALVGYSVIGCLVVGTLGACKALASSGLDAAACLLASVAAFATVYFIYHRQG